MVPDESKVDIPSVLALLASAPYTIQGQWYLNQSVSLDGYKFVYCRFDTCNIITSKGTFSLDHCFFSNCRFYILEEARNVVQLANIVVPEIRQRWPYLAFQQEADGTLSIKS